MEENAKGLAGFLKWAVEVGFVGGWEVRENKLKKFDGEQGRASLWAKRRETWWGIWGVWKFWIARAGGSLRELMMSSKQWAWRLNDDIVQRLTEGGSSELTGTGARAEVEGRARGRKAETRMSLRFNYNKKQSWRKKEQSVKREAAGDVWGSQAQPSLIVGRMCLARVKAVQKTCQGEIGKEFELPQCKRVEKERNWD